MDKEYAQKKAAAYRKRAETAVLLCGYIRKY